MPSGRERNGIVSSSRVSPQRTASGKRATSFAATGVSVSRMSRGVTSHDKSSAPADTCRTTRSKNLKRSSGCMRTNAWR